MIRTIHSLYRSRPRLFVAFAIGIVAAIAIPLPERDWMLRAVIGWDVAVTLYLVTIWALMLRADEGDVREFAKKEDEKAYVILIVLSLTAVMSLIAITLVLADPEGATGNRTLRVALAALTVAGSWLLIPTIFGVHYAHLYYLPKGGDPPLQFPDEGLKPDYADFLYFSFTLAVAFATSDVRIVSRHMRLIVMTQAVLSFFFNAGVLAFTLNMFSSLLSP